MDIRIDKRDNGFRVRWHHNGMQGREQFASDLELKAWLARFDFVAGRDVSVVEEAARSFGAPADSFPDLPEEEAIHFRELERRVESGSEHDEATRLCGGVVEGHEPEVLAAAGDSGAVKVDPASTPLQEHAAMRNKGEERELAAQQDAHSKAKKGKRK